MSETTATPQHVVLAQEAINLEAARVAYVEGRDNLARITFTAIYLKLKDIFNGSIDGQRIVLDNPVSLGYGLTAKTLYVVEFENRYEYHVPASGGYDSYSYEAIRHEPVAHTMTKPDYTTMNAETVLNYHHQDNLSTSINWHHTGKVDHQNQIDGQEWWTLNGALAKVLEELEAGRFTRHEMREYVITCACGHVFTTEEADDQDDCPECDMSREDLREYEERQAARAQDNRGYGSDSYAY